MSALRGEPRPAPRARDTAHGAQSDEAGGAHEEQGDGVDEKGAWHEGPCGGGPGNRRVTGMAGDLESEGDDHGGRGCRKTPVDYEGGDSAT